MSFRLVKFIILDEIKERGGDQAEIAAGVESELSREDAAAVTAVQAPSIAWLGVVRRRAFRTSERPQLSRS